jgi:hypothetical protein
LLNLPPAICPKIETARKMGIKYRETLEKILIPATKGIGAWMHRNHPSEYFLYFALSIPKGIFIENAKSDINIIS